MANPGVASGVGIRIYNDAGTPINLLPDRIKTGTGNARGWYGYKDLTTRGIIRFSETLQW